MAEQKQCALCGASISASSSAALCPNCGLTYWKCGSCGFLLTAATPPDTCPGCKQECEFRNVTCYTPECGGPGNIDPRL